MMERLALADLKRWMHSRTRKPMVLRGARQVGKSTLVRLFARRENLDLVEFDLERERLNSLKTEEFELSRLLDEIQLKKKKRLGQETLIFFDEIQALPKLLSSLKYFYEQAPELKVIAAGSLLEIALASNKGGFSFPVGRIEFHHLGPMSFKEFLWATQRHFLDEKLQHFEFSPEVHKTAIAALKDYYYVGGMPEAVKVFSEDQSLATMRELQEQIIQAYEADFPKYNKRINVQRIARVFRAIALATGKKMIYSKLDRESASKDIKRIVELLVDAKVVLPCVHSDANQTPLLGESDPRIFKPYFLDIGLLNALLKLDFDTIENEFQNRFSTKGMIAEQFVAQHLNFFQGPSPTPGLVYHLRDKGTQKAEIDFLIERKGRIYPIEVKAAPKGHLKSLKYFCRNKKSPLGIKMSLDAFSIDPHFVDETKLVTLPLYAIEYLKDNFEKLE